MTHMNQDFFVARRPHAGWTYAEYKAQWADKLHQPMKGLDKMARKYRFYAKYNDARAGSVEVAYSVSPAVATQIRALEAPQLWMVLTEDWCADSAYALPVIAQLAALNPRITLRILPRDENLDIMDQFLTRGGRAIPKLVAFDEAGEVQFTWGARPQALYALREEWGAAGATGAEVSNRSLAWYEAGGYREVEEEIAAALTALQPNA